MSESSELPRHLLAAPAYLSAAAKEFFLHETSVGSYDAPARLLLIEFCEICDQLDGIRGELRDKGNPQTFTDKHGQPREHPLRKRETALVNEKGKLFRLLGWDQQAPSGQLGLFGN